MWRVVFLISFLAVTCSAQEPTEVEADAVNGTLPIQNYIVGGQPTTIAQVPYQASLRSADGGTFKCGGSIISKNYILTAAHCFPSTDSSLYSVGVGSTYSNSGGSVLAVAAITVHPRYDNLTLNNDFAIVHLKDPIKNYNSSIRNIPLASANQRLTAGTLAKVSGWGKLGPEDEELPTTLNVVNVPLVAFNTCKSRYKRIGANITKQMLCAGYNAGGKDSCQGDSGGPLVQNKKLIGVVSFGKGCAEPKYPGIYARVSSARNWIRQVTGV